MSVKEIGCGGRDSCYIFIPCRLCLNKVEKDCIAVLAANGLKKHEEYWTPPEKMFRRVFSGRTETM